MQFPYHKFLFAFILSAFAVSAQTVKIAAWGNNGYGEAWVPANLPSVKAAIVGSGSGLALLQNGRLAAWGSNASNQTNVPASATNISAIAKSFTHCVALRSNGTAVAWGAPINSSSNATNLGGYSNVRGVAAGGNFTLLLQGGQVTQLPMTLYGAYGIISGPSPFTFFDAKQIGAGDDIGAVLRSNGTVVVWGNPACTNPPPGLSDVQTISVGSEHVTALRSNGTVVAWGENYWHQTNVPPGLSNVVAISAGSQHTLALRNDGSLVSWGDAVAGETSPPSGLTNIMGIFARGNNSVALVGDGPVCISKQPKGQTVFPGTTITLGCAASGTSPLTFQWQRAGTNLSNATNSTLLLSNVMASVTGDYTVIVSNPATNLTSDVAQISLGNIAGWGWNRLEEIEPSPGLTDVSEIFGGNGYSLALRTDGTVSRWGANLFGIADPKSNVVAMARGNFHALFLHSGGIVSAWGENIFGETSVPANLSNVVGIAAGSVFSLALKQDKTVVAWGDNFAGKATVPVGLSNVIAIVCGSDHALALKSDGKIVAWGYSGSGQTNVPINLSNAVAIASGANSSLALKLDGTLQVWGTGLTIPAGISNIVAISAYSYANAVALRSDGTVVAFGSDNGVGQNDVPAGVSNVVGISAGWRFNLALTGDGAPVFPTPLIERSVLTGTTLQLSALAAGVQPMTYQWQFNGGDIPGQTNSMLTISNVPLSIAGAYRVVASNSVSVRTGAVTMVTAIRDVIRLSTISGATTNGLMNFRATGLAGAGPIIVHVSTNLASWQPILTNSPAVGAIDFTVSTTGTLRFFRVSEGE
ncbi:MAG: immunoglobulin domain-containing protein [Verrucomicrobiota bacterium]